MIRAVVNADDFGISSDVNAAIVECFKKRIISNTTLMVTMEAADEAVLLARENGFDDRVGLHLNLTAGYPLTKKIRKCPLFCNKNGEFNATFHLKTLSRLRLSSIELACVYEEAEAQIIRYLSYGLPEKHLDSHHHVHTDLAVWKAIEPLLKKYNFRTVRLGRNMILKPSMFNRLYKFKLNRNIKKDGYAFSKYFGSYKDLREYYKEIENGAVIEVMTHPMYNEEGVLVDTKTPMQDLAMFFDDKKIIIEAILI